MIWFAYAVGVLCNLGGLSLLVIPLGTNGSVPRWQKAIHWTSCITFVTWGHACFFIRQPLWILAGSLIGAVGCLEWTRRYVRMMRRAGRPVV
jgi:hypothetical protein